MIQSVHRAIKILSLFSLAKPSLGISEISRALSLHKATVQNLVRTLNNEGVLQRDPETRKYQLGLRLYEFGVILTATLEINQKASEPTHQLAIKARKVVHVAIRDGDSAIITLDAYPRSQPYLSTPLGLRFPLYCTALGKALLAYSEQEELDDYLKGLKFFAYTPNTILQKNQLLKDLEKTRQRGYSINREEHLLSRAAIGAPIFGNNGKVIACLSLVCDPLEITGENINQIAADVIGTAVEISRRMGYYPEVAAP